MSGPGGDSRLYDTGGAWERTALAWQRTALALGLNGLLVIRTGTRDALWLVFPGLLVVLAALVLWVGVSRTYRRRRRQPTGHLLLSAAGHRWALAALAGLFALALTCLLTTALH